MFNPFLKNSRPFMDADSDVGGGAVAPQGTEGTADTGLTGEGSTGGATGTEETQGTSGTDPASQKQTQTPEQNAAFAQMRREAEAAKKALQERDAWVAQKFGQSHGITTWDQYQAAIEANEREQEKTATQQREQTLRDQGIDPNLIREILKQDPEYQTMRQQLEQSQRQIREQQSKERLDGEFKELSGEHPEFKTINDYFNHPNYDQMYKRIQQGYSLLDAYESVNKAEIRKQQAEAARQATLNSVQSKGHLKGNGQGSEVDTSTIPDDVLEMYKTFNPGKTLDEYKTHYKASLK